MLEVEYDEDKYAIVDDYPSPSPKESTKEEPKESTKEEPKESTKEEPLPICNVLLCVIGCLVCCCTECGADS